MFLGAAIFAIIVSLAAIIVLKALHTLLNAPFWGKKKAKDAEGRKDEPKKESKSAKEKEEELEQESIEEKEEEEISEETRQRFADSLQEGISEAFSSEESTFRIDGKAIADQVVEGSSLSYLEYNNRELAGEGYLGFNLIVEEDCRMVLTYGGCAVATLTKIERETTAVINGETVTGTMPAYRTNTFPPELKEGMVVGDLEKMLEASERIKSLDGDPSQVSLAMQDYLTRPDNVSRLKDAVIRKIQAKESVSKTRVHAEKAGKGEQKRPYSKSY